jgi:hypothetical protein
MIPWGLLGRKVITRPCSTLSHIPWRGMLGGEELEMNMPSIRYARMCAYRAYSLVLILFFLELPCSTSLTLT